MQLRPVHALRGPNLWSHCPVMEFRVDVSDETSLSSDGVTALMRRLEERMPSLRPRFAAESAGLGTTPARALVELLAQVTLEWHRQAGTEGDFAAVAEMPQPGIYRMAIGSPEDGVTQACAEAAFQFCRAEWQDEPFEMDAEIGRLCKLVDDRCLGRSTAAIIRAAAAQGIPWRRVAPHLNLIQLGHGVRQRRIWTAETDRTSTLAEQIAFDKGLTKELLAAVGVPVPEGRVTTSRSDAWQAAVEIGGPVVVKPLDGNWGRGLSAHLTGREEIEAAYDEALRECKVKLAVVVERFIRGTEHRLLVVGGRMVAAAGGDAISVTGDGRQTIRELIESQVNSDPRRGMLESQPLGTVTINLGVTLQLSRQGYTPDSIPDDGTKVLIRHNDNLSTDVTDRVHPQTAALAELAARVVGLDIAGLDVVAEDISRPLDEQGGAVVEVNAGPGLLMHLRPVVGQPRPVDEAIVRLLFEPGADGRIPLVAITGTNCRAATAARLGQFLRTTGRTVGVASTEGVRIGESWTARGDQAGPRAQQNILLHPDVEMAVFEIGYDGLLGEGLGFDRCQVVVVTEIGDVPLPKWPWLSVPDDLLRAAGVVFDTLLPDGTAVLNADDPRVAALAARCQGSVILFGRNAEAAALRDHIARGGRAVTLRDGQVVLIENGTATPLAPLPQVEPIPTAPPVWSTLAALAAAWALAVPRENLRSALAAISC